MSTTSAPAATPRPDAPTGPIPAVRTEPGVESARHRAAPDNGGPGETRFDDAAVQKIATYAVSEVDQVGGAAKRVLGVPVGAEDADRSPKVDARVDGSVVTLAVRLSVTYPAPVGQVTRNVRAHVIERLTTLTGLHTDRVDIVVAALHTPAAPVRRLA